MLHFENKLTSPGSREKDLSAAEVLGQLHDLKKPERPEEADPEYIKLVLALVEDLSQIYFAEEKENSLPPFEVDLDEGMKFDSKIDDGKRAFYVFSNANEDVCIFDDNGNEVLGPFEINSAKKDANGKERKLILKKSNSNKGKGSIEIFSIGNNCHVFLPAEKMKSIIQVGDGFCINEREQLIVVGKNGLKLEIPVDSVSAVDGIVCTDNDMVVHYWEREKIGNIANKLQSFSGFTMGGSEYIVSGLRKFNNEWRALVSKKTRFGYDYLLVTKDKTTKIDGSVFEKRKDRLFHDSWEGFIKDGVGQDDITKFYFHTGEAVRYSGTSPNIIFDKIDGHYFYGAKRRSWGKTKIDFFNEAGRLPGEFDFTVTGLDNDVYLIKKINGQDYLYDHDGQLLAGPFKKGENIVKVGRAAGKTFITLLIGTDNKIVDNLGNQINVPPTIKKIFELDGKAYFLSGYNIYQEDGQVAMVLTSASQRAVNHQNPMAGNAVKLLKQNGLMVAIYCLFDTTMAIDMSDGNWTHLKNMQFIDVDGQNYYIGESELPSSDNPIGVYDSNLGNTHHYFDKVLNTEVAGGKLYVTGMRDGMLVREKIE